MSTRARGVGVSVLVLAGASALVSACSSWPTWQDVSESAATLGSTRGALYVSPQSYLWGGPGHVILGQDATTPLKALKTSDMDNARLTWTHRGLFFSDTRRDYLLGDRLATTDSPKTNSQVVAFSSPDGSSTWSLLIEGLTGDTYTEQAITFNGEVSVRYDVDGFNQPIARCRDGLFGVAILAGPSNVKKAAGRGVVSSNGSDMPQMLARLHPPAFEPGGAFVAAVPAYMVDYFWNDAACDADGNAIFLAKDNHVDAPKTFEIRTWNVRTGKLTRHALRLPDASEPSMDTSRPVFFGRADRVLHDGKLMWIDSDGGVRRTDPATGATALAFTTGVALRESDEYSLMRFESTWLLILQIDENPDMPMLLHRFDTSTGAGQIIAELPSIQRELSAALVLRDFAVAPELLAAP